MSKDPNILDKIHQSIAPGIFGHPEIKKAIACMLFGGSRKHLPDETILRGDINILLIGDPSTAKSQFLKFVEQAASIAVYTSGKGSSAAGLTASITKDSSTGEFQIEGGALVLADGGIVCIDEFDKMKQTDRVAIHEAMEQQTISVAKAGITTRLNSRTSVLAAANPIHGRYDDLKELDEQIELQNTILSRFDCIFIVRDINTPETNNQVAGHILDLHQGKTAKTT
jgi:DNA replication licensing factor MCM5